MHVTESFAASLGLTPADMIGRNDLEIGMRERMVLGDPESGWPGFWALDDAAIAAGTTTSTSESDVEYAAGRAHQAQTQRTPLRDAEGRIVGLLVQSRDVTAVQDLRARFRTNLDVLDARDGEITTLDTVMASMMSCRDSVTLLRRIADTLIERTVATGAFMLMRHESGDHLECVVAAGARRAALFGARRRLDEGLAGRAWRQHGTVFVDDADAADSTHRWGEPMQVCVLPIGIDGELAGAICVCSGRDEPDLRGDVPLLERISGLATIALANTQLVEASAVALKRTRALAEVSRLLATVHDTTEASDAICRLLLSAMDISRASCYLVDADGRLVPQGAWGRTGGDVRRERTLPPEMVRESLAQWCVDHARVAEAPSGRDDPRESARVHVAKTRLDIGSACAMPILERGRAVGALLVSRDRARADLDGETIALFRAVTDQLSTALERSQLSSALHHQAYHDSLTALPNRFRFEIELIEALDAARSGTDPITVLFLDLDGFKAVNDTLGHAMGDRLLILVAERFNESLGELGSLARMGGDEFAVVLEDSPDGARGTDVARGLSDSLSTGFELDGKLVRVGTSIGLSRYPDDGTCADELLRRADMAMYHAKHGDGEGGVVRYTPELENEALRRAHLETELRDALDHGEFTLAYQPQVRCGDGRVHGVEALIRWQHPERGLVPPAEFIPMAEATGLIDDIGAWVIDEALHQLAEWNATALGALRISVNVAASQFRRDTFVDVVLDAIERHGARADRLELEVTESVVMTDIASVVRRLERLRGAGVRIAVDDFGTGYSSLSYLQDLPLDVLKVDRSFVKRLHAEATDERSLVNSILRLAAGLGLETVSEGVETPAQRDAIMRMGGDTIQGYFYSKPVAAAELKATVEAIHANDAPFDRAA